MKNATVLCVKTLLLSILLLIFMAAANLLVNPSQSSAPSDSAVPILIYSLANALILTIWIKNSRLRGIRLAAVCFVLFWGTQYFMTQIETLFFDTAIKMPFSQVLRVVLAGALYAAAFSPTAVWILGKFKRATAADESTGIKKTRFPVLLSRLAVLALVYAAVYFLFGYFVAWQFPAVRLFYSGSTHLESFLQDMENQSPVLALLQIFRGFLWALLAYMTARSLKGKPVWEVCLLTGLLFSVLIATPLLFPNAYMPAAVRFGHSLELFSSMLVYGILCGFLLKPVFSELKPAD